MGAYFSVNEDILARQWPESQSFIAVCVRVCVCVTAASPSACVVQCDGPSLVTVSLTLILLASRRRSFER